MKTQQLQDRIGSGQWCTTSWWQEHNWEPRKESVGPVLLFWKIWDGTMCRTGFMIIRIMGTRRDAIFITECVMTLQAGQSIFATLRQCLRFLNVRVTFWGNLFARTSLHWWRMVAACGSSIIIVSTQTKEMMGLGSLLSSNTGLTLFVSPVHLVLPQCQSKADPAATPMFVIIQLEQDSSDSVLEHILLTV